MTDDSPSALDRLRARKAERDAAEQAVSGERLAIVVVDDEKGNLDAVVRVLGARYHVTVFEQAEEALAHVDEAGCADLYITDQRMPHMSGVEFLTRLVEKYPQATGIILSGYTERADLIGAINQAHVAAYVTKPWRPAVLMETIESALELSATRKANADRNQRLSSLSSRLDQLDDSTNTDDFLAGFDDLEAELDAIAE
jgi:two-component system response regulator HupR/HoxA